MLSRRMALAGLGTASLTGARAEAGDEDRAEWNVFKARFLHADGRVIDTGNQGVSHTEGQGWGMLLAEYFGDQAAFGMIWGWTARNLGRPHDALHSWRYDPASTTPVADPNNATDGDLFIGMALSRAGRRWGSSAFAGSAAAIGHDVIRLLVRTIGPRTVLLPGVQGFETTASVVLNPSYYVFPALLELGAQAGHPAWDRITRQGAALVAEAGFGRWKLPPDWLQLDCASGRLAPAPDWPPRFSYDATRVPLYLAWARLPQSAGFEEFVASYGARLPAWVDLVTDEAAPYGAPSGLLAVAALAGTGQTAELPAGLPPVSAAPDYYSAALSLLVRVAWRETRG